MQGSSDVSQGSDGVTKETFCQEIAAYGGKPVFSDH